MRPKAALRFRRYNRFIAYQIISCQVFVGFRPFQAKDAEVITDFAAKSGVCPPRYLYIRVSSRYTGIFQPGFQDSGASTSSRVQPFLLEASTMRRWPNRFDSSTSSRVQSFPLEAKGQAGDFFFAFRQEKTIKDRKLNQESVLEGGVRAFWLSTKRFYWLRSCMISGSFYKKAGFTVL